MTTKCEHCKGARVEPGEANCTWCDNTGMENGLSAEVMSDLKPFRLLPYGAKFRYQGTPDVWVRTGYNLVAEWPSRVSAADGTPIQSLCCFCHLDEDVNTLDTLVEVVDHEFERDAALGELKTQTLRADAAVGDANEAERRLTAADERVDVLETALKKISVRCVAYIDAEREMPEPSVEVCQMIAYAALKPAEGGGDDTTLEEDREDFKKVFVRINTKQGQSISLADMIARYEKKP